MKNVAESYLDQPKSGIPVLTPDELETPPLTLGQLTWRRFRRHKMAMFGVGSLNTYLYLHLRRNAVL